MIIPKTIRRAWWSASRRTFNRLGEGVKTNVIGFTAGKYWITGEFDKDNLLERVVTRFPDPVLGDMAIEVRYSDWKDIGGGAKFPFHIHAHQGDHPLWPGGRMECLYSLTQ